MRGYYVHVNRKISKSEDKVDKEEFMSMAGILWT
jgi:hypothetical protein